ncbi:MAG: S8 family serine peptidase, partial [candidate division Zixibacteria bacterium]|nr:S8 family serine peptidase [candidate division Zixibacteria bacterium]
MKQKLLFTALIVLLCGTVLSADDVKIAKVERPDAPGFVGYVADEIVVKFDRQVTLALNRDEMASGRTGIWELDELGRFYDIAAMRPQFQGAIEKTDRASEDLAGWHKIKFKGEVDVERAVEDYKNISGVLEAQPIGIHTVYATPNDGNYDGQWHLNQTNDADIDAEEAWDIETGDESVIVAILDSGVRYYHKDLGGYNASPSNPGATDGNMWINWAEKNGSSGVDDDGNGYVDDWVGWDFVDGGSNCWSGEDCDNQDNDPRDFNGHGTHCAGNLGAINNNGYATCAPAGGWGDGTLQPTANGIKVMACRIGWSGRYWFYEVGYVRMDFIAEALYYAADNGARIASCSWGASNTGGLDAAVDYFINSGGLIFKAAGNDGSQTADYMCARSDVISVAATDSNDCKADFSTYGTWVDISAPGTGILSLYHDHADPGGDYVAALDGTSMATPLAASVAAMIWSQNPTWSASQVKQQLLNSADDIDNLSCNSSYAGKLGAGRINAYNAVNTGTPPPSANFSASPTSGCASLNVIFTDQSTGTIDSYNWDFGDGGTSTAQNPSHTYASGGTYTVELTVTGPGGSDTETKTDYITVNVGPSAAFVGSPTSGTEPLTVSFTDQSSGATSWSWDFGDGGTSTAQNPTHEYTSAGTYTVELTAT